MATFPALASLEDQVTNENIQKLMQQNPGMTLAQARAWLRSYPLTQPPWATTPESQAILKQLGDAAYEKTGAAPYMPKKTAPPAEQPAQQAPQPIAPVKGTNEQGETTYTFTQGMMGQLITQVAKDSFVARDPNSNIGINPPRTQAEADALPQDPISTLARNANATPLPDDVLAQLRMDAQAKQQALGSSRPANPMIR